MAVAVLPVSFTRRYTEEQFYPSVLPFLAARVIAKKFFWKELFIGQSHLACGMQEAFERAWLLLKAHVVKAPLRHETVRRVNSDDFIDEYEGTFLDDDDKDNPQDIPIGFEHDKERGEMFGYVGEKPTNYGPTYRGSLNIGSTVMPNGERVYHPLSEETASTPGVSTERDLALHMDEDVRGRGYAQGLAEFLPHILARNPDLKFSPFLDGFTDSGQGWIDALQEKHPEKFRQLMEQHMPDYLPLQFAHYALMNNHPKGEQFMQDAVGYINDAMGHDPTLRFDPDDYAEQLKRFQETMDAGRGGR